MNILVTGGGLRRLPCRPPFLERGHDICVYDNLVFGHRAAVPADRLVCVEAI